MKKYFAIFCGLMLPFCSCSGNSGSTTSEVADTVATAETEEAIETVEAGTQVYSFKDSCQHLVVKLSLELPTAAGEVSTNIRQALIADFMLNARQPGYDQENEFSIKPYTGNTANPQAIVDYYGKADYDHLLKYAKSDYNDRIQYLNEESGLSEEEKERIRNDVPMWTFELNLKKSVDAADFVIYYSQSYVYYGGAHGGVAGSCDLTFNKKSGKNIDKFLKPNATKALQPLFRKGLLQYYRSNGEIMTDSELSDRLQLSSDIIPQPTLTPCPNAEGDSLVFTYRQYEIACYADGMPSFAIAAKDLMPYLTEEAKEILKK